jgi:hypothetical protein
VMRKLGMYIERAQGACGILENKLAGLNPIATSPDQTCRPELQHLLQLQRLFSMLITATFKVGRSF